LSPYLFNNFINDIIGYIDTEGTHSPMIKELRTQVLLFADDLVVAYFTSYGLQKKIELVDQYYKHWDLKCSFNQFKIKVFKKRGKLKATDRQKINGQCSEVVDKFNYLGVTENKGSWNKQKILAKTKGYQAVVTIDKCIPVTHI
jgi:hypothetical protein